MRLSTTLVVLSSIGTGLVGCASVDSRPVSRSSAAVVAQTPAKPGGYYKDDGPGLNPPANLAAIPDAVPQGETLHRFANRPYSAVGKDYVPMTDARGYKASGLASWYGRRYHGQRTSSGEVYDMYGMTAAHPTLPIPSYARVSNPANGRSVIVRINDRGPFHADRLIDLSYTAAWKLDLLKGVARVEVQSIDPGGVVSDQADSRQVVTTPLPPLVNLAPVSPEPTAANLEPPPPGLNDPSPGIASPGIDPYGSGTYLQLGAFSSSAAVERLQRQLEQRLGDSLPGIHRLQAGNLIKLQVGPFATLVQADAIAERLEQEIGIRPYRILR